LYLEFHRLHFQHWKWVAVDWRRLKFFASHQYILSAFISDFTDSTPFEVFGGLEESAGSEAQVSGVERQGKVVGGQFVFGEEVVA